MLQSGTDPKYYITQYALVYEIYTTSMTTPVHSPEYSSARKVFCGADTRFTGGKELPFPALSACFPLENHVHP